MSNQYQGTVTFMTDPFCSWCWGTLPALFELMERYKERLDFKLKCAGLQVGPHEPLSPAHKDNLLRLWREVAEVTGQPFTYKFPEAEDFIYHSEKACRAVQIARQQISEEPWQIFYALQNAFYVYSRNLSDLKVLYELTSIPGLSETDFKTAMNSSDIINLTRTEFAWCSKVGISALPTVFLDTGAGPRLVAGGFATAESLSQEISARLTTH